MGRTEQILSSRVFVVRHSRRTGPNGSRRRKTACELAHLPTWPFGLLGLMFTRMEHAFLYLDD